MRKAACIVVTLAFAWIGAAHENLQHFVHHTATFAVTDDSIDVSIDVVFYGEHARSERGRMDTDGDTVISSREWSAYQADIAKETADSVSIMRGDIPLETAPLYDPEVDMHGDWARNDSPVTVQLVYFAQRPSTATKDYVWVQDTLWLDMPAVCFSMSEGSDPTAGESSPIKHVAAGERRNHHVDLEAKKGEP